MPTIYSHSRLSSFENCPKQFHFRYVLKIPQESEGIEAFVGKRVHEVLERLHEFADRGMLPPLEKVLARYRALWETHFDAERIRIVRSEVPLSHYLELGERCLRNYYRSQYPFDEGTTLGLEERVLFDLDEAGRYRFQGIIDRLTRAADGVIEIHDYKTGQRVPSQAILDRDRQLALYQLGLMERYGADQPMRLVWHYVASGKQRSSQRSAQQLEELRTATIDRIDGIQGESSYRPQKQPLCSWCEYKSICPAWTDTQTDTQREPTQARGQTDRPATAKANATTAAGAPPASPQRQLDLL